MIISGAAEQQLTLSRETQVPSSLALPDRPYLGLYIKRPLVPLHALHQSLIFKNKKKPDLSEVQMKLPSPFLPWGHTEAAGPWNIA